MDFDDAESLNDDPPHPPTPHALPPLDDQPPLPLEYEQCPHCSRNFFKGKLKFHLKLCNAANPMLVSPRKTPGKSHQKLVPELTASPDQRCPHCSTKLPSFLYDRHIQRCQKDQVRREEHKKAATDVNFKQKPEKAEKGQKGQKGEKGETVLPAIKRSGLEPERLRKAIMKEVYRVKVREELSCFRRAQEIKQVQCVSCGRIFSKEASLRHIPICETLRSKAEKSIALHKKKTLANSLFQHSFNRSAEGHKKSRSLMQEHEVATAPIQAIPAE